MALIGAAALVWAALYAPFFHVHYGGEHSLLHAHFGLERVDENAGVHIESPYSDATARAIDIVTSRPATIIHLTAVLYANYVSIEQPQACCGFTSVIAPRNHAPPAHEKLPPRSPPA